MRWLLALLFILPSASALLTDAAGDVSIDHCGAAQTPIAGHESMDLRALTISQTPHHVRFMVETTGLAREANYDAGNYFIQFWRGDYHYTLRMLQDNSGTGAILQVILADERTIFGPVFLEYPASVQGTTIVADMPKNQLRDREGYFPVTGDILRDVVVSSEAHSTGLYGCPDSTGPAIIQDKMPDDGIGVDYAIEYGGGTSSGPVDFRVQQAFRASNGEAMTYAFVQHVTNNADTDRTFTFNGTVPADWGIYLSPPLTVPAGETGTATTFVKVPFVHVHGTTTTAQLSVATNDASASAQIGVFYLEVAQPAGHHPTVFLHSLSALGIGSNTGGAMGDGDHLLYWNTLQDDPSDHQLPISSSTEGGDLVWYGCLSPDLLLGMHPDINRTGKFSFELDATVATTGTLSGMIGIVPDGPRPSVCNDASEWEREAMLSLEPVEISVDGPTRIEGDIKPLFGDPRPFMGGSDLLLEIRITPDSSPTVGGMVKLLPGGRLDLPLLDYHEPAPEIPDEFNQGAGPAAAAGGGPTKDTPPVSPLLVLLVALAARRALK